MKMVLLVYNRAIGEEVEEALERCDVRYYTKFPLVHGVGEHSGPHMDSHIWPGANSLLMIACQDEVKDRLLEEVRALRERFRKEGIKAFVVPLEDVTS